MTIFTIGYEGLDVERFIKLLKRFRVETLIDVRERAQSRKKGFSKTALDEALAGAGIEYDHMAKLGCPKPVRDQYRKDGNWSRYKVGFRSHLETQEEALETLAAKSVDSRCALLCFEADFNFCHRSMVAEAVQVSTGAMVEHILKDVIKTAKVAPQGRLAAAVGI